MQVATERVETQAYMPLFHPKYWSGPRGLVPVLRQMKPKQRQRRRAKIIAAPHLIIL